MFENAFGGKTVTSVMDMDTLKTLAANTDYTFADGKLTISKDYFTENKTYSFAVVTDDSLYFATRTVGRRRAAPARARIKTGCSA